MESSTQASYLILAASLVMSGGPDGFLEDISSDLLELGSEEGLIRLSAGTALVTVTAMLESDSLAGFMGDGNLDLLARQSDDLTGALPVTAASAAVWAAGSLLGDSEVELTGRMMTEGAAVSFCLAGILKLAFSRERPDEAGNDGFPSGHATLASCVSTVAWDRHGPALGAPLTAVTLFSSASRVHLGRHHPSDVAAGLALGIIVGSAVCRAHEEPLDDVMLGWSSNQGIWIGLR